MKANKELIHDVRSKLSSLKMAIDMMAKSDKDSDKITLELIELVIRTNNSLHGDITSLCNSLKSGK
jgi:hypothetical protein